MARSTIIAMARQRAESKLSDRSRPTCRIRSKLLFSSSYISALIEVSCPRFWMQWERCLQNLTEICYWSGARLFWWSQSNL